MRILTVPDGGTVNVLDRLRDNTRCHARRTLARAKYPLAREWCIASCSTWLSVAYCKSRR